MMLSLDRHLSSKGLPPSQRSMRASMQLSWTLGLDGTPIFGGSADRSPDFSSRDLLARVHDWYSEHYGNAMKIDMSPGKILIFVNGNLWKLQLPMLMGSMTVVADRDLSLCKQKSIDRGSVVFNVLCAMEGLTQTFASNLSDRELAFIHHAFAHGWQAIMTLDALRGHHLFDEARSDYRHSVDAVATGREYGKGRWETAQCAEKLLKGLLAKEGHSYPKNAGKGHDHVHLGTLIGEKLGISLDERHLATLRTSPAVRYGEESSTLEQAMGSHAALLCLLRALSSHQYIE